MYVHVHGGMCVRVREGGGAESREEGGGGGCMCDRM